MDTMSEGVFCMADGKSKNMKLIVDAALKLFREKGYEHVSVNDICTEAGIARSTFYLCFSGKRQIIDRVIAGARLDREQFFGDFVAASNDFERMWILCDRYLTVAIEFGPELVATLFSLELSGELDILDLTHQVDEWMIQLCANAQKAGIILSPERAEVIAPLGVSMAYYTTYEWAKRRGSFDLRQVTRQRSESLLNVAPEHRMSDRSVYRVTGDTLAELAE